MRQTLVTKSEYDEMYRSWERDASLPRRVLARIGIEGKLILGFLVLMLMTLGGSYWQFTKLSQDMVAKLTGDHLNRANSLYRQANLKP